MSQRRVLVLSSAATAAVIAFVSVSIILLLDLPRLPPLDFVLEALALSVIPTTLAACLSAWVLTGLRKFGHFPVFLQALAIVLLAYPFFLSMLLSIMSGWAYVKEHLLDLDVGHAGWANEALIAFSLAGFAFIISVLPAVAAEYWVVRFVRRRWSPAFSSGVVP